jgi:hypothetical protein
MPRANLKGKVKTNFPWVWFFKLTWNQTMKNLFKFLIYHFILIKKDLI